VRLVAVTGPAGQVERLVEELVAAGAEVLTGGPDPAGRRIVLRFDYAAGPRLAAIAKAALVRAGSARRPKPPAPPPPSLRVRFDPHEPL